MFFFLILLSLISGLTLLSKNTFFYSLLIIGLIVILIIKKYKKDKKLIILIVISFIIGIILSVIKVPLINKNYFFIIEKYDNYLIGFNGLNKVYLFSKSNDVPLFSLIKVKSNEYELKFGSVESGFNFNEYLKNKGIHYGLYINKTEYLIKFPININNIKNSVVAKFDKSIQGFISSLLFKELDYDSNLAFKLKNLNLVYLFGFSGIYLNFVLYSIKKLLSLFIKEKYASLLSLGLFSFYLFLNINNYLVIRVIYFYLARHIYKYKIDKQFDKLTHLSIFSLISLLIDHYLINSYSFTIYLIYSVFIGFSNLILSKYKKIKKKIITSLLTFIILLPFTINFNNSINIFSLLLQFLLIPILKILFCITLIAIYGIHFSFIDNVFKYFEFGVGYLSFDKLSIYVSSFNQFMIGIYYLLLVIILYFIEVKYVRRSIKYIGVVLSMLIINIVPFEPYFKYKVSFINVGQCDSTLISYKDSNILIDTGGLTYQDLAKTSLIPYFKKNKIYKLDAIFITHEDYDHYGALSSLQSNFRVGNIYSYDSNFPLTINGIEFSNLNTYKGLWKEENDRSCVFKFTLKGKVFLIMGDATKQIERKIIDDYNHLRVDYLKVGHHGSNTSSDEKFISTIDPKVAIISCGYKNKYNHPSSETIDILNKNKITIRRTDIEGTVTIFV